MIAFARYIAAIGQAEFIPVQRAHNIAQRIYPALVHQRARMRALGHTGFQAVVVESYADFLSGRFYQRRSPATALGNLGGAFGHLVPFVLFFYGHGGKEKQKFCAATISPYLCKKQQATMENTARQLINAKIFTGSGWIENGHVLIENGRIADTPANVLDGIDTIDCDGNLLVPAFLDLQIYGAGGRLFSAYPDAESLAVLAAENRKGGTVGCLATIATQPLDIIYKSVAAIHAYWQQGGQGILGMHLEGPYMNPIKRGAHKLEWMRVPTEKEVGHLLEFAAGAIKMVTVATEICPPAVIKMFADAGVVVSAGHSNATYQQAQELPWLGVNVATHLFNAMSPLHHRDVGLPGAIFDSPTLRASIIPDGIHVSYAALRIAKKQMGERLHFITDAVTETSVGEYQHQLNGDHYCVADGTLSGSALTMLQGVKNSVLHAGIPLEESLRMASLYPAQVMGLEADYGSIAVGKKAALLLVDDELELKWLIG